MFELTIWSPGTRHVDSGTVGFCDGNCYLVVSAIEPTEAELAGLAESSIKSQNQAGQPGAITIILHWYAVSLVY